MFAHIRNIWFCLAVLHQQKKISCFDRLRLWVKSINLYICLLGFADKNRPVRQTRNAMICAFLSAIYDYETDWQPVLSAAGSAFLQLLNRYVDNSAAKQKASKLFLTDLGKQLSKDGLERGSGAFKFYCAVIASEWLSKYSEKELDKFGRSLQQVDDLLDLERDRKHGDTNCFLGEHCGRYVDEVNAFLLSDFFRKLMQHSCVYILVRWRFRRIIQKLMKGKSTWNR